MDLGSGGGAPVRAYESGDNACGSSLDNDYDRRILPSFRLMSEQQLDTEFWNLSEQSRLPVGIMPHISYSEALKRRNYTQI